MAGDPTMDTKPRGRRFYPNPTKVVDMIESIALIRRRTVDFMRLPHGVCRA